VAWWSSSLVGVNYGGCCGQPTSRSAGFLLPQREPQRCGPYPPGATSRLPPRRRDLLTPRLPSPVRGD
jgi:hypothetical protein